MDRPQNSHAPGEGQGPSPSIETHSSSLVEKVLEYRFLAELGSELLRRDEAFEILRSDCDRDGYDVVVEASGILRHMQLKAMKMGGRRFDVTVNTRLAAKPSGCLIWMIYNPTDFSLVSFKWFGSVPGRRLPALGDRVAKHSRANAKGLKAERPQHRVVTSPRFRPVGSITDLVELLFGPERNLLLQNISIEPGSEQPCWVREVGCGNFSAVPDSLTWETSLPLAMLVDGYGLAKQAGFGDPMEFEGQQLEAALETGTWGGGTIELWVTLFLQHRRWRFSSPYEPDPEMKKLLDRLVFQLRTALKQSTCAASSPFL
ncbi:hypothetical protein SH591_06310 [Sphingomonas sp. LY54]|uniref:hypothetical protein n=1 Tax=Sphingomonas sp. LY54 TaxID=3095343 RepID=UPI002D78E225|nr:hypothetical protein [Sphingomonas sp. LY54]WRP29792.1 hypothetical protein SH591_06310 [Sphingomonas sp. LY54]